MDKLDRIQALHRIFKSHKRPVSIGKIAEHLQCSEKNAKRIIEDLRDRFFAPIEYDIKSKGWHYDNAQPDPYELPGLWLTSQEIEGFALILHLLNSLRADTFSANLKPIEKHIEKLLASRGVDPKVFSQHIKLIHRGDLNTNFDNLVKAADAINSQQCLEIRYQDYSGRKTQRMISPLTLVYYSENWYLDAWCFKRKALRSFQLPRVLNATIVKEKPYKVDSAQREEHFASSYGIFAGKAKHTAKIYFSPTVAQEIVAREWHPAQTVVQGEDGSVILNVPYNDDRELMRDILKYGHNAEVLKPAALRNKLHNAVRGMMELYV